MTEQSIFDNKNITANSEQIAILKKHFPNCFDKEGNFLINSFKEIIKSNDVDTSHEGYTLNWLGKSYARLLANEKPRTLIRPDKEHNAKEQNKNSNNLLIKGDNLEVLKHLKNAYTEAVKVIYIDPPYNTGSDGFVYKDDRRFTKEELANLANVSEEEAQRILDFTDRGSNSHSAWLTFIYPRLYIARELLREDGVIFISIDDNEQAQLKLLCDEVFGEENFIANLVWAAGKKNDSKYISTSHEYILCYFKNSYKIKELDIKWRERKEGIDEIYKKAKEYTISSNGDYDEASKLLKKWFKSLDDSNPIKRSSHYSLIDEKGVYFPDNISWPGGGGPTYEVLHPVTRRPVKTPSRGWIFSTHERMDEFIEKGLVKFGDDENYVPTLKSYLKDREDEVPYSVFYKDGRASTKRLMNMFEKKKIFENPKDEHILKRIINFSSNQESLILDFFAGSGTTAHAVMELNAEDEGNRQYIMVQLPEETDKKSEAYKANFKTIFDITKARIEKAAEKIQAEKPEYTGDLGFKIFETTALPEYYDEEIDKLSPDTQTQLWDGSEADENLLEAILTTWTLYDRISLTTDLDTIMFGDYKTYYGKGTESNTLYLMYKGFNIDHIKLIIDKLENDKEFTPKKIVIYGHNFDTKSQRELSEALNSFRNKKSLEIDIIKRY